MEMGLFKNTASLAMVSSQSYEKKLAVNPLGEISTLKQSKTTGSGDLVN